jgi:predicted Fe-Mo cluster-binding NifX family protein
MRIFSYWQVLCFYLLGMKVNVAIPEFENQVAPRFETAGTLLVFTVADGKKESEKSVSCSGCKGFSRVRVLQDSDTKVLLCNGIEDFYVNLLNSLQIDVIANISLSVYEALNRFIRNELPHCHGRNRLHDNSMNIPHEDLVCWAKDFFRSNGYRVEVINDEQSFPIDLVAEIKCPVCKKNIRVAICCGAHIYNADQEIREFYHNLTQSYHARVYVHPFSSELMENCQAYNIELIDPNLKENNQDNRMSDVIIPILSNPIRGHEKAFRNKSNTG